MPTTYAIKNGRTVFTPTTYTGTGANQTVSNAASGTSGFKPDLIWFKVRSTTGGNALNDSVRGVTKSVTSNGTDTQYTSTTGTDLLSFNSNGFSVGPTDVWNSYNLSGGSLVGWQWQAGQGTTSTNTAGSITSTVSVNQAAGFSVVTWTGTGSIGTVGHGLGVAPQLIICKNLDFVTYWFVYSQAMGNTAYLCLNVSDAVVTGNTGSWNNTSPTSTVFTLGSSNPQNYSGNNQVAYCWAPVPGFSQFGSYTGNASTSGPFIYTGFRPAYVMVKRTDALGDWEVMDTSRNPSNAVTAILQPNLNIAETVAGPWTNILSNGFQLVSTNTFFNASGGTYIYAAFAECPFKYANAR